MKGEWIVLNGDMISGGVIPIEDRGYLLGDGVFTTIGLYNGLPFLLDRHLIRLQEGALALRFNEAEVIEQLREVDRLLIKELGQKNGVVDRGVGRITLTRRQTSRGYQIDINSGVTLTITVRPYNPLPPEPMTLVPVTWRKDPTDPLHQIKSTSSAAKIMAMAQAKDNGGEEGVVTTMGGALSSAIAGNLFWVVEGALCTPATTCALLQGTARGLVIEQAKNAGIGVTEGVFLPEDLLHADEVFYTNALREVVPVGKVDTTCYRGAPGPITTRITTLFQELVRDQTG